MTSSTPVVVSTFRSLTDALVAQGLLESAGVGSMIRTDDAGGMYPSVGGAALMVRPEDVETATAVLSSRQTSGADDEGAAD